jgi:hypothetical protein
VRCASSPAISTMRPQKQSGASLGFHNTTWLLEYWLGDAAKVPQDTERTKHFLSLGLRECEVLCLLGTCWTTPVLPIAPKRSLCESGHFRALVLHCEQDDYKSAKEPLNWRAPITTACGATFMPQVPAGCPRNVAAWGARKRGYRLNRARASASNPRLTRDASQLIVPSMIALVRRGSLWALATLLAVLASARLLRRYGRLSFTEFSWEKVAYRRRFSRSSPLAQGFAPTAPLTRRGAACKYWRTFGATKNGPMREFGRLGGGLIDVLLSHHNSCK